MVERTTRNGEVSRSIRLAGILLCFLSFSFFSVAFSFQPKPVILYVFGSGYVCLSHFELCGACIRIRFAQACVEPVESQAGRMLCTLSFARQAAPAHNNHRIRTIAIKLMKALKVAHTSSARFEARRSRSFPRQSMRGPSVLGSAPCLAVPAWQSHRATISNCAYSAPGSHARSGDKQTGRARTGPSAFP